MFDDLDWSDTEYRRGVNKARIKYPPYIEDDVDPPDEPMEEIDPPPDEPMEEIEPPPDPLPTPVTREAGTTNYAPFIMSGYNNANTTTFQMLFRGGASIGNCPAGTRSFFYIPFNKGDAFSEIHKTNIQISCSVGGGTISYGTQTLPLIAGSGIAYTFDVDVSKPLDVKRFDIVTGPANQTISIIRYYKYMPPDVTLNFYDASHIGDVASPFVLAKSFVPTESTVFTFPPSPSRMVAFNVSGKIKLFVLRNGIKTLIEPQRDYSVPSPGWTVMGFDLTNYPTDTTFAVELTGKTTPSISAIGITYKNVT